jgi:preprotein translocase subunit SecG
MMTFLIVIHVIICVALIFIVLMQTSKGGLDSNFGGVATNMLGTQGANEFVKLWTKILFSAFVISCVLLAFHIKRSDMGTVRSGAPESILFDETHIPTSGDMMDPGSRRVVPSETSGDMTIQVTPDGAAVVD